MPASALMTVMLAAARKAGRSLARDFGEVEQLQVSLKGPANFVSAADTRAEEILFTELSRARPGYGFLMEERGVVEGADGTHRWIVDPLDGTTNFLHGIPHLRHLDRAGARRRAGGRTDLQSRQSGDLHRRAGQGRLPQRSPPLEGRGPDRAAGIGDRHRHPA